MVNIELEDCINQSERIRTNGMSILFQNKNEEQIISNVTYEHML